MRIALIHPAGSNWMPGRKDITATANRMAPLGLLSIAAWLEQEGHRVFVYDGLGPDAPPNNEAFAARILADRPEMAGFSATTSGFLDGVDLAERLKEKRPDIRTVFGGVHISAVGGPLLSDFPTVDYLCMGEGEATLAELASGSDPAQVDGLGFRDGGKIVVNPPHKPIQDLDSLPFPAYQALAGFPRSYHLPLFSYIRGPGATMVTSRGCPYRCTFCDRSVFGSRYRFNSAEYIYEHMRYLRDSFGVRHINIYDDLFTVHRGRIIELCRKLSDRPLGLRFNCAVRVGHADKELLDMLKAAGCLMVSIGIESGDEQVLARQKAGVDLQGVRRTVHRIKDKGLRVKGLFMMGLPEETAESIRKTSDFALSLGLDDMNMAKFTPFPGAPVWKEIPSLGTFECRWPLMNCLNFVFLPQGIDSFQTLDRLYNWHVQRFYRSKPWRRKFARRFWQHRESLLRLVVHMASFWSARNSFAEE
jgi:radical SAM superfamily enzyme YgiQ (UPF0313 family)